MKKIYTLLISILLLGAAESNAQCSADFMFFPQQNTLTVSFIDSSFYGNTRMPMQTWNMGDGTTAFGTSVNHTYPSAGTYTVCLTIQDSLFTCFDTICKTVVVQGTTNPTPCNASFTYTTNPNNAVSFISGVTGGVAPYAYNWDFGDGNTSTGFQNPTHTYANPGSYGVTLTVTGAGGITCTFVDTVTINTCSANFSYRVGSNGSVSFTNLSNPLNAALVNIFWDFGDGNFSNAINPTHTYTNSGLYNVTLSYFDSLSNCSASYTDSLFVTIGAPSQCNASYTKAKDSTVAYGVVLYNTSSSFGSHFYTWDFGDGTTGSGRTPIHQFQNFGNYVVCLTITDSILNCTTTFCDTVGMDSLGNLKSGFGIRVLEPVLVGVEETEFLKSVKLYPNPATSDITLDLTAVQNEFDFQIMDISGRVVRSEINQVPGNLKNIDLDGLESGLYFMTLTDGVEQITKKFIKQ